MRFFTLCLATSLFAACGTATTTTETGTDAENSDVSADVSDVVTVDVPPPFHAPTCDPKRPPIVFAHGFLAASDTWSTQFQRLVENGVCPERLFVFDWNTLSQSETDKRVAELDSFIDGVTKTTGAPQVDLVGHSAGGGLGYSYLSDAGRAKKVRRYAHVASFHNDGPAGPDGKIPTLNLWSDGDLVASAGEITGATNEKVPGIDHYAVATSEASFVALWKFFGDGTAPAVTDIRPDDTVTIHAKALTLGENAAESGAEVAIWALDAQGAHSSTTPAFTAKLGADGKLGPFAAKPSASYAFVVKSATADKPPITYFHPPFVRSDALVYLRTLPSADSLAGTLLSVVPFDDTATVVIVFSASRAIITGKDSLSVDGTQIATPELADAKHTAIAFFVFDENSNGVSDGTATALFQSFPFLSGVDQFMPPTGTTPIVVELNGQRVAVPHQKSKTEGPVVVVFP